MTIEEYVQAGIQWLDENGPADWRDRVDLAYLHMESMELCMLGQVFRDEAYSDHWSSGYGYAKYALECPVYGCGFTEDEYSFSELEAAWIAALSK